MPIRAERAKSLRSRGGEWLTFAAVVLVVWIAGQIIAQGLSDENVATSPTLAVAFRADSADALLALAQARLAAQDPAHAALYARRALADSPLKVAALSTFGVALDQAGRPAQADQVMTFAGRRGWRDALTQFWLLGHRLRARQYDLAFQRADALLRRADRFRPVILSSLIYVTDHDPSAMPALIRRLRYAPDWRDAFFMQIASDPTPASEGLERHLLESLRSSEAPASDTEIAGLVQRSVRGGRYAQAMADWRQLSRLAPPAGELVVDGDFDHDGGIEPFGWSMPNGVGWTASAEPAPAGGHGRALRLQYDGFSRPQPFGQLLVLRPGSYSLSGRSYLESGFADVAPHWLVSCVQSPSNALPAYSNPNGPTSLWRDFRVDFSVPSGCAAEILRLAADPGDHHSETVIWYDDLVVRPVTPG